MADPYGFGSPLGAGYTLTGAPLAPAAPRLQGGTFLPPAALAPAPLPMAAPPSLVGATGTDLPPQRNPWDQPGAPPPALQGAAYQPPISQRAAEAQARGPQLQAPTFALPPMQFGSAMGDRNVKPAAVDPAKIVTAPGGSGGAPNTAAPAQPTGNPFLDQYLNLIDAQKAELLRPQPQGRMVRPPAPEPLLRLGRLQGEAGNIDQALATGEKDIAYRRADNGLDLAAERNRGIEEEAKLAEDREAQLKPIRDQISAIQQQVTAGQVEPDRLWNKASTAERAGFMVAAMMAGVGQSIAGRGGQQNAAMQSLFQLMDRDNSAQVLEQQSRGQKASDLGALYKQVLDTTGSKQAAVHAANIAKLDAMQQQFEAEYENLRAKMPVGIDKRDPVTGQPIKAETTILDLRLDAAKNAIQQRRAQEDLLLQQQIAAATKPVGMGGGGNNKLKKLQQLTGLTKAQMDAQAEANKAAKDAGKDEPHAVFDRGNKLFADPNAPKEAAFEGQKKINMANMGLATVANMKERLANAPAAGLVEKGARLVGADRVANLFADEARLLGTDQVTGLMSQLSGAGVPSETQARLFQQLMAGGPGATAALNEAERILNQGKQVTIQGLGVR